MKYILVVDDEKIFQLSLLDGLRTFERDFRVLSAENGKEAKDILKRQKDSYIYKQFLA